MLSPCSSQALNRIFLAPALLRLGGRNASSVNAAENYSSEASGRNWFLPNTDVDIIAA